MKTRNLIFLILIELIGAVIVIAAASHVLNTEDLLPKDKVPIYVGAIAFLGGIATAIFQEMSSRYKEKRDNARNRWQLAFPALKESYIPWLNAGKKFSSTLEPKGDEFTDYEINRILYFICLFFGIRLDFILKHGGSILLKTKEDEEKVDDAYKKLKESLEWAGDETAKHTSNLQHYFISNNKPDDPMVFQKFADKLDPPIISLRGHKDLLIQWLQNREQVHAAKTAIDEFVDVFDQAIADFSGREK